MFDCRFGFDTIIRVLRVLKHFELTIKQHDDISEAGQEDDMLEWIELFLFSHMCCRQFHSAVISVK